MKHKKLLFSAMLSLLLIFIFIAGCGIYVLNYYSPSPTLAEELGYTKKDILVIVNMDDIGLHPDETDASIKAINFDMAKSGSVMVPCPDFERTLKIWKENQGLDLGIHLTLTCEYGMKYPWTPILPRSKVPSLYNNDGIMWPDVKQLAEHANIQEAVLEMEAQINKVLDSGIKPTHMEGHMGFYYANNQLFHAVMNLSKKYKIPMRVWETKRYKLPFYTDNILDLHKKGYVFSDSYFGKYIIKGEEQDNSIRMKLYYKYLQSLKPGVHEIIAHFAFKSENLSNAIGSQNDIYRYNDFEFWTDKRTKELADKLNIKFIGFKQIKELQDKKAGIKY
jgi:chitin disaccharide deacetylase